MTRNNSHQRFRIFSYDQNVSPYTMTNVVSIRFLFNIFTKHIKNFTCIVTIFQFDDIFQGCIITCLCDIVAIVLLCQNHKVDKKVGLFCFSLFCVFNNGFIMALKNFPTHLRVHRKLLLPSVVVITVDI